MSFAERAGGTFMVVCRAFRKKHNGAAAGPVSKTPACPRRIGAPASMSCVLLGSLVPGTAIVPPRRGLTLSPFWG